MAMCSDRARPSEQGLSLIEALVIVTVTALIAMLLLPMVSRTTGRNFALADRALDAAALADAERQFTTLMQAVAAPEVGGDAIVLEGQDRRMTFVPNLAEPAGCAQAGVARVVRLRIVISRGVGRLMCDTGDDQREVARWAEGEAAFSYSDDGVVWRQSTRGGGNEQTSRGGAAPATYVAPFVKFELRAANGRHVSWIQRVGWTEAAIVTPPEMVREAQTP